jgi:hypothetical protein
MEDRWDSLSTAQLQGKLHWELIQAELSPPTRQQSQKNRQRGKCNVVCCGHAREGEQQCKRFNRAQYYNPPTTSL